MSRITRIFQSEFPRQGESFRLDTRAVRHLVRVLRLAAGDGIRVFDGRGREHSAMLTSVTQREVVARIDDEVDADSESPLDITLLQGISRGERMDFVMQKSTELGVSRIVPVMTARSVVRLDESRAAKKRSHWQSIAVSACEQSGRSVVPEICCPLPLPEALNACGPGELRLFMDPAGGHSLKAIDPVARPIVVLIGPEGGFDAGELAIARAADFESVYLGPRILRTETAALAVLAAIQSLWGDLAS
ncbi:MAG: 16S rRNA (uracil(1498)-N(3))-methyltransferase [Gammaproteobacteria bacterium]